MRKLACRMALGLIKLLRRPYVWRLLTEVCVLSICLSVFIWRFAATNEELEDNDQARVYIKEPDIVRLPLAKHARSLARKDNDDIPRVIIAPLHRESVAYALAGDPQPIEKLDGKTNLTGRRSPPVKRSDLKGFKRVNDACASYSASAKMIRTVQVNVLGKGVLISNDDITLVTQLTSERLEKLYNIVRRWSGPISVSVYVSQSIHTFITTVKKELQHRRNIAMHVVAKHGAHFPVNFLRNVALRNAQTKYVFLTDVDFEPMPKLDIRLQEYIEMGYLTGNQLLVVPVFESKVEPKKFPANKQELLALWTKAKTVKPFHFDMKHGKEYSTPTQSQTDYPRWKEADEPYLVNWALYYEPYVVTEKSKTPEYWPDFVGRFYNKFEHLTELFAMGYEFLVLPDVFALHTPHSPQPGTPLEKKCGKRVLEAFRVHLIGKYGVELP